MSENPFALSIPEPNEMFRSEAIHPRNLAIEERRERARILSKAQVTHYAKLLKRIDEQLTEAGYDDLYASYRMARSKWLNCLDEREALPDDATAEQIEQIEEQIESHRIRLFRLSQDLQPFERVIVKRNDIRDMLKDHEYALQRERLLTDLRKEMAKEAINFAGIIVETWARLGYKYEYMHRGKRFVDKVMIETTHITPDQIYFKIAVTSKGLLGYKQLLPQGVKAQDLISEETLHELSIACQRQVTTPPRETRPNGAWVIVNRLSSIDGLMAYVTIEQVLNNYPHEDRVFLPIGMGVGEARVISWVHLAQHPHFLIGGSTGGGKSNAINVIICTLIQKHSPSECQLVLIDLKEGLEFQHFDRIPHLLTPVVKDIQNAAQVLAQLETLRQERAQEIGRIYAKDIDQYNARRPENTMPRIVIIFDEYAAIQISKDYEKAIQNSVMQLLNKGRAVGIHLIICTQNPSVDIIPGASKANMAFRLAGKMPTKSASMTILGVGDAADLPDVRGRMIAMVGARIWHLQVPHVRESDLKKAIEAAMQYPEADRIELPEAQTVAEFGEHDVIELALNYFGGKLSARLMWEMIKDQISQRQMSTLVKQITSKKTIEYDGKVYELVKVGRAYEMREIEG
jgi:hypothetical protein